MKLGVGLPSFASDDYKLPPDRFRAYAQQAESLEFSGLWLIEHLVQPPTYAMSLLDPLSTLAYVAGHTDSIPIGTSVLLLPLRNPVLVAQRAATIQHLATRRVTLGLGTGYVSEEFDAVGVPREERSTRYREGLALLNRLLASETVTYSGEHYAVDDFRLEPRTDPRPRLLAGGGGVETDDGREVREPVRKRLDDADGWIAAPQPIEALESDWRDFADYLESRDRDPDRADRVALQYLHLEPSRNEDYVERKQRNAYRRVVGPDRSVEYAMTNWLSGTVPDVLDHIEAYEQLGFDELILHPAASDPAELERQLRLYHDYVQPEFH